MQSCRGLKSNPGRYTPARKYPAYHDTSLGSKSAMSMSSDSKLLSFPDVSSTTNSCDCESPFPCSSAVCRPKVISRSPDESFISTLNQRMVLMDCSLIDITNNIKLSDDEYVEKIKLVDGLSRAMMQNHPWYHYDQQGLFMIGSALNGFGLEKGDVDVCLMMSNSEVPRSAALRVLTGVQGLLHQTTRWSHCEVIRAIVPILTIRDKTTGVSLNMNINNIVGVRNTHLLRCFANFDWRVKPLVLFVKKWAKSHGINSAKNQTICSYALTLMVINYLQCGLGGKPVLPAIQQAYPNFFNDDIQSLTGHVLLPPYATQYRNQMTVSELLLGFFEWYGNNFRFDKIVMSVRLGKHLLIDDVKKDQPLYSEAEAADNQTPFNSYSNAQLYVEEPFNRSNVARSVYDAHTFIRIREIFRRSYETLRRTRDPFSIINIRV